MIIAGTKNATVTRSFWISLITSGGTNSRTKTILNPPTRLSITTPHPAMWKSGIAISATSDAFQFPQETNVSAMLFNELPFVSCTPFGWPVVPLV
jgi:hypothetical protein